MPATVPEIIKMFYNCGGERQTFACLLTQVCPHLARARERGYAVIVRGAKAFQRVVAALLRGLWRGTRKRRHLGGITALWDGRPTLRDGKPTLCEGRPALREAIGRHGALWDGRPALWDGRPTLWVSLPPASEGLPPSNAN